MSTIPRSLVPAFVSAALLAACGGGGGGDGPTVVVPDGARTVAASPGSDATAVNYATLAPPFVRAVLSGGAGGVIGPLAADRAQALAVGAGPTVFAPSLPGRTMLAWLRHLPDPARKRAAAVSTETLPCGFGGTITVRFDDADNDGNASAGDSIEFTASNCIEDAGLPAASGGFTMSINAVDLDGDEPVALDVSGSFQNFTLVGYGTLNGSYRLWTRFETAASTRLRVSYMGATVAERGATVVYDFDIDGLANDQSGSFEISGGIGIGGATYAVSTGSRLQAATGQSPAGGNASFRDAAGDSVRVVPRSATSFDLEFYPAGATVPSVTLTGLFWADYED
jgi:hypothetical protein